MTYTLAIVGRPNVGKSTLFNRLAGKKLAIVDDTPGVTRDWREADAQLFDMNFRIIDTAGLEDNFDDSIQGRMRAKTEAGLAQADAVLFMIDGRSGVTPLDENFASWLRKQKKTVILGVNKCENQKITTTTVAESYTLGLGDPIALSAEHNIGMEELYHALREVMPDSSTNSDSQNHNENEEDGLLDNIDVLEGQENFEFTDDAEDHDDEKSLKIAIVGRPNVGKSTLLNAIVQEDRVMTGPEAGITRDAIAINWSYQNRSFKLVDTAGMRRKSKVQDSIEKMSVEDSLRAIRLAQVTILVLDGNDLLEKQDLQIADHIINEGRALVIAVNKWDIVNDRKEARLDLEYKLEKSLSQIKNIPWITISAMNNRNIDKLLDKVLITYEVWNRRVSTGKLNGWLKMMESRNPAPLANGRQNRMKYITQIKTRPPTFALWVSRPEKLPKSYKRYIVNGLRRDHNINGVPVRLLVRKSKNPYA